jgi:hypothetical protein
MILIGLVGQADDVWDTAGIEVVAIRVAKTVSKPFLVVKRKDIDLLRFVGCFKTIFVSPNIYLSSIYNTKAT